MAVTDQLAGQRTGMSATLESLRAGDEGCFVAIDFLHESPPLRRHIVDQFRLLHLQTVIIDNVDIGAQSGVSRPRSDKPKKSAVSLV